MPVLHLFVLVKHLLRGYVSFACFREFRLQDELEQVAHDPHRGDGSTRATGTNELLRWDRNSVYQGVKLPDYFDTCSHHSP